MTHGLMAAAQQLLGRSMPKIGSQRNNPSKAPAAEGQAGPVSGLVLDGGLVYQGGMVLRWGPADQSPGLTGVSLNAEAERALASASDLAECADEAGLLPIYVLLR